MLTKIDSRFMTIPFEGDIVEHVSDVHQDKA